MNIRWLWFLLAFWLGLFHMAHGGVKKTDFNPKYHSIRLDTLADTAQVAIKTANGDSLYLYFTDQDSCSYIYYDGTDSTWKAKPCGKEEFTLTDTSGLPFDLYLPLAGGTMQGNINMNANRLLGVKKIILSDTLIMQAHPTDDDTLAYLTGNGLTQGAGFTLDLNYDSTLKVSADLAGIQYIPDNSVSGDGKIASGIDITGLGTVTGDSSDWAVVVADTGYFLIDSTAGGTFNLRMPRTEGDSGDVLKLNADSLYWASDDTASAASGETNLIGTAAAVVDSLSWGKSGDTLFVRALVDSGGVDITPSTGASGDSMLYISVADNGVLTGKIATGAVQRSDLDTTASYKVADLEATDSIITPIIAGGSSDSLEIYFEPGNDSANFLFVDLGTYDSLRYRMDTGGGYEDIVIGSGGGSGSEDSLTVNVSGTEYDIMNDYIKLKAGTNVTFTRADSTSFDDITISSTGEVGSNGTSVDNEIVKFHGTTGDTIQGSTSNQPTISDAGLMTVGGGIAMSGADITGVDSVDARVLYADTIEDANNNRIVDFAGTGLSVTAGVLNAAGGTGFWTFLDSATIIHVNDSTGDTLAYLINSGDSTGILEVGKLDADTIGDPSALGAIDIEGMLRLRLNGKSGVYGFDTGSTPQDNYIWKFDASDSLWHLEVDAGSGGDVYQSGAHSDNEIVRYDGTGATQDSIQAGATSNPTISDAGIITANAGITSGGQINNNGGSILTDSIWQTTGGAAFSRMWWTPTSGDESMSPQVAAGGDGHVLKISTTPSGYDSMYWAAESGGGGDEVFIEGNALDSVNIEGTAPVVVTFTADGDGGSFDTAAISLTTDSTLYNNGGELSVTALDSIGGSVADDQVENNITVWRADTADIADTAFAAERTFIYAIVNDGGADSVRAGTPVYISGYDVTDNIVEVDSAKASGASTMPAIGIAKTAGNAGDTIIVITAGELTGQNTGSFTVGEPLYIGSGGGLTETKPTGTNLIQKIGETKRVNASQGEVVVFGAGRSNDVPNIPQYNVWLGNASGVATAENLNNYLDSVTAVNYPTADSAVVAANSYTADYSDSAGIFTDRDSTSLVWGSNVVLPENGVNDDNAVSLGTEAAAFADLYLDGTLDVTGGTINFDAQSLDGADIKNNEVTSTQLADDVDFDSVDTRALFADTGDVNTGLYSLRHWTRGFALFIDTGGGTMYAPFDTVEANEPAADDVFAWDAATNSWEIKAQTGGSGTADSLSVNVSGTEYDIMSDYVKLAAGTGITFTRTDVGPGTYDSISISSTGGGDQVEIEGNAVDTVNIEGGTGITVTYTADGDGGGQDTATVAVTAQSLTKTQFDTTTTPIFAGLQLSGNLTLNMDSAAADVTIDFGQTGVDPQLLYDQSHDLFAFNEVLHQDDWSWLVNTSDTAKFDNTDNPTNGQQLTWATGGIIRWEDAGSGTGYWTLTEASGDTSIRWIEGTDSVLQIELDPSNDSVFVRTDDGSSAHVLVVEADKIGSGTGIITVESDSTTIDSVVYFTGRTQMDSLNLGGTGWMVDPAGQNLTITSGVLDAADTVRQADTATYLTTSAATGEWVAYNASLNQFLPHTDAATSLGATSIRFTDAYLSGTLQAEAIQTNNEVNNELQIIPDTVRPNDDRVAIWGTPAFEIKRVNAASIVADTLLSVDSADITNFTDGNIDLNDLAANSVDSTKVVANSISIPSDLAQATKAELEGRISDVSNFAEADGDTYSNTHDFTTAVLEIPNSLNPNPTAVGRIAQDQNDYAIVGTDGTNDFWLGVQDKVFIWTIDSAAALVNDSVIILPIETTFWPGGITLTSLGFKSRDDATDSLWFEWWTEPEADVGTESVIDTLTQAGATEVTSTSFTDATGAAGEMLVVIIKLASGQPLTVFGSFRVNTNN